MKDGWELFLLETEHDLSLKSLCRCLDRTLCGWSRNMCVHRVKEKRPGMALASVRDLRSKPRFYLCILKNLALPDVGTVAGLAGLPATAE